MTSIILATAVETLLGNYNIVDIILIIFLAALGVKEVITLIKWFKTEGKTKLKKEEQTDEQQAKIEDIDKKQGEIEEDLEGINRLIEMLITADKNDIKAWITDRYHTLMSKGWVDDYELDCLERRFSDYDQMGGNSYIEDLMADIRKLPKQAPIKRDYFIEE